MPVLERKRSNVGDQQFQRVFPRTRRWRFWRTLFLSGLKSQFSPLNFIVCLSTKLEIIISVEEQPFNIIYLFYLLYGEQIHQRSGIPLPLYGSGARRLRM